MTLQAGDVVLVRFPFTDLTAMKLRSAVVLAIPILAFTLDRNARARPGAEGERGCQRRLREDLEERSRKDEVVLDLVVGGPRHH